MVADETPQEPTPGIDIQFGPQGLIISGGGVELPAFISERLQALCTKRNAAREILTLAQTILDAYGQGICDGMGLTSQGQNVSIDLDRMTYRVAPKEG